MPTGAATTRTRGRAPPTVIFIFFEFYFLTSVLKSRRPRVPCSRQADEVSELGAESPGVAVEAHGGHVVPLR